MCPCTHRHLQAVEFTVVFLNRENLRSAVDFISVSNAFINLSPAIL
ncbi:unnamed protein product [Staurois parvus]|uniref:Uncharacterized protein n=1 Tax=Staurois parvus TaxID=386267 RepID=A0ABN9AWI9_9NEOB|nr:unnamed protein product [Staurois parvus]